VELASANKLFVQRPLPHRETTDRRLGHFIGWVDVLRRGSRRSVSMYGRWWLGERPWRPTSWLSKADPGSGVAAVASQDLWVGVNEGRFRSLTCGIRAAESEPCGGVDWLYLVGLRVEDPGNDPAAGGCKAGSVVLVLHEPSNDPLTLHPGALYVRNVHHKGLRGGSEAHGDPVVVHVLMLPNSGVAIHGEESAPELIPTHR
jgi:hypothetical protein